MILHGASIVQMGWLVRDVDEAARRFSSLMGVGPFLIGRHAQVTEPVYRGRPGGADISFAVAQAGELQIELIQQHDATPSVYHDLIAPGREGFHHLAVIVPDVAAECARYLALGHPVAASGRFGGAQFAYVDTSAAAGHMVEILEDHPAIREFFGSVRSAAQHWNRRLPVVELTAA